MEERTSMVQNKNIVETDKKEIRFLFLLIKETRKRKRGTTSKGLADSSPLEKEKGNEEISSDGAHKQMYSMKLETNKRWVYACKIGKKLRG